MSLIIGSLQIINTLENRYVYIYNRQGVLHRPFDPHSIRFTSIIIIIIRIIIGMVHLSIYVLLLPMFSQVNTLTLIIHGFYLYCLIWLDRVYFP